MKYLQLAALIMISMLTFPSFACQFNTDCAVGSKCMKASGKLEGICAGGMEPGNTNDRTPYHDSLDISQSVGDTCSFDTDCGVGAKCSKESGKLNGVCVKR